MRDPQKPGYLLPDVHISDGLHPNEKGGEIVAGTIDLAKLTGLGKPIMVFQVRVDPSDITEMSCPQGAISILPFRAQVTSPLFTGETLPGAVDVQMENAAKIRNMSARYTFQGKDETGRSCILFVDNEGYFTGDQKHDPILHTCPHFLTDSPTLGAYLHQPRFRGEVRPAPCGVEIWIFDVCG